VTEEPAQAQPFWSPGVHAPPLVASPPLDASGPLPCPPPLLPLPQAPRAMVAREIIDAHIA